MQSEALSLWTVIMVGIRVVLKAALGVAPRALEVDLGQHFGQSSTGEDNAHIAQDQPEFQLGGQAQKKRNRVHSAPPSENRCQGAVGAGETSVNKGLVVGTSAGGIGVAGDDGRRTARPVK